MQDDTTPIDVQGHGQSAGVPANAEHEGHSYSPLGRPGVKHWQQGIITEPGLQERGNVFFAAIEMTRMPMVLTDPRQDDNPIVFCNRAFCDLLQVEEAAVLGRNCRFLQGPDTDPAAVAEVREAVAQQRALAIELLNYRPDGSPFWNALFMGPVYDRDGQLQYWFASMIDVSPRRANQQTLLQAQKMEAIGQLTAGIAHDFNNLLHVVVGNLDLAKRLGEDNPALQSVLERAGRAAAKGGQLTQQLLSYARKQRLAPREVSLNDVVVGMGDLLVRTLGEQVDLRLDLKLGLPPCRVDPTQLEMALLNLLLNARDALPTGGKVTVATQLCDRDHGPRLQRGQCVVLCVRDEGQGMPPEVLAKATEPFFTTKGLGTGLGLAMVHGFVGQSDGKLEIESTPGRGTTVRMVFPQAREAAHAGDAQQGRAERGLAPPQAAGGEPAPVVWVVEDNDDVRQLAEVVVAELGCEAVSAANGDEALRLLGHARPPQVVLTDIMMPGDTDGFTLVERLKQAYPQTQALLMTGYADMVPRAAEQGDQRVLTKPFQLDDLKAALSAALRAAA